MRLEFLVGAVLLGALGVAQGGAYTPHAEIRAAARQFVLDHADSFPVAPEVTAGTLDSRLRLHACSVPLEAFAPPGGLHAGRGVVGVRCEGERPWRLYIQVEIALPARVVVTRAPVARGERLAAAQLTLAERDLARLHKAWFTDLRAVLGKRLKRALGAGRVLQPSMLERPLAVERGDEVTILASSPALQVRMKGEALADGGQGDRIRVRNLSSGRRVEARVVGPGRVRVLD